MRGECGLRQGQQPRRQTRGRRLLLFLNPDTETHGPSLNRLCEAAESLPQAGALGARLLNSDGSLQTSCLQSFPTLGNQLLDSDLLRKWFPKARLWGAAPLYSPEASPAPAEGISGACLLTPRAVFEQVGGFSEDYFMYYEDMDYCRRVQKAGFTNYYVPQALVVHHGGKSSAGAPGKFSSVMMAESARRYFLKEHGPRLARVFRAGLGAKALLRSLLLGAWYLVAWPAARREQIRGALRKWTYILRWSLGGEGWVSPH